MEFTEKSIWDLKLYSIGLSGKMSHKIELEIDFLTLKSSVANDWMFLWWILNDSCKWLASCYETSRWVDNIQTEAKQLFS